MHYKCRFEKGLNYPERFPVTDAEVEWSVEVGNYTPPYYVAPVVIENDESVNPMGWAEPENYELIKNKVFNSYCGPMQFDNDGYPLNPFGRTGLKGRGLLGKWGPNFAADPIITRVNANSQLEMLAIQRKDTRQWAIPGGMVDSGELASQTLQRELKEEAGIVLNLSEAETIFKGYVDDPRNTDNAWMESTAAHLHLSSAEANKIKPKAGSDAAKVQWIVLTPENMKSLYADHGKWLLLLKNDARYAPFFP